MTWPSNRILRVLHVLGMAATARQIASETGYTLEQVWDACETLVDRGLATRPQRGSYAITEAGQNAIASGQEINSGRTGPRGPGIRTGTFRERLWKVMRIERKNTIGGWLALILADGEDQAKATENAQKYIRILCLAGYMAKLPGKQQGTALTSNGFNRYLLAVNNGPLAPITRRGGILYDPNSGESMQIPGSLPTAKREVTREP